MARAKLDPEILAHLEWLGFIRPTGLVVSAPALVRAGAILDRRDAEGQRLLHGCVEERTFNDQEGSVPYLPDFRQFAEAVLGWTFSPKGYAGTGELPIPAELEVPLPDYRETLRPNFAVREIEPKDDQAPWQLLVLILDPGDDFDHVVQGHGKLEASAHGRLERLLRHTGVPAGLLFNGRAMRLLSAPRGESSGWLDFRVADMAQTAGRPISTAFRLLLSQTRLLSLPSGQRLAALLEDSRKYQNEVSERLAEQVLHALYELLRGFQAAHDASKSELLRQSLAEQPDDVYRALLTVILRLVFLLYAEERDMLPEDETFLRHYSLAALFGRLREDAALFPDTMDQRYSAWAQLLVLFRMIHDGAESGAMRLPQRHGVLFDPDRFPFLEGRALSVPRQVHDRIVPPLVPDGTIYRALDKLLVLDGERISYRALDVEQIGSVYETMMGFRLETATGRSAAIKPNKRYGAPTTVDLEELLAQPAGTRGKWIQRNADRKVTDKVNKPVKAAATLEDLHAALLPLIDQAATPDLVPPSAMVLQPSEERRRSGSHYTPRALTEPIVRTTLEPILARMRGTDGRPPRPEAILDLKVCDPAMGSGAFLVEACRQLGDELVEAWHAHEELPAIPPDEDEVVHARRLIAQRCLYGVDLNPVAVDLAKVSLWLVTLAKDHALTFVDHALRHGDSLVGLSRRQVEAFHWDADSHELQLGTETMPVRQHVANVAELRTRIREAGESLSNWELRDLWDKAQFELGKVRIFGDLLLAAFFEADKPKERETKRREFGDAILSGKADRYRTWLSDWRHADRPLAPFHWQIEFPEVLERENPGFDAIVGNPPYLGGTRISTVLGMDYFSLLRATWPPAGHLCDLAAYFFRRAFDLARVGGAVGFVTTKTIAQGDTRKGGLAFICENGGTIFSVRRRLSWPGRASVVVATCSLMKGDYRGDKNLDGERVEQITAFFFDHGGNTDPARLAGRNALFSAGSKIYGQGFLFDDLDEQANSLALMRKIVASNPRCAEKIRPYIGGDEVNSRPQQDPYRFVIDLNDVATEAQLAEWPELEAIVREKVKPYRNELGPNPNNIPLKRRWWAYQAHRPELYQAAAELKRVLVGSQTTKYIAFSFQPTDVIYSQKLNIFLLDRWSQFSVLQSRVHEAWALFFGSTLGETPVYTPSDCFETFPFPDAEADSTLEAAGADYYEARASVMLRNSEGLTKTYNRFNDPDEQSSQVSGLRDLHAAMDRVVLDAYGWGDIRSEYEFLHGGKVEEEGGKERKESWRYRWPDAIRDEVLARLLELNAKRAQEEVRSGTSPLKRSGRKGAAVSGAEEQETQGLLK